MKTSTTIKMKILFLAASAFLALASTMRADVTANPLFSDNAVLQQDRKVPVWGAAAEGEKITVEFAGQKVKTVSRNGQWKVCLEPMPASAEGRTMTIRGNNTVTVQNILLGEVWLCSGQSNMESNMAWFRKVSPNGAAALASATDPLIRIVRVPRRDVDEPETDAVTKWNLCDNNSVADFSAVAYFFGRDLRKQLGVPVGLIGSYEGGTPAESWTDRETLSGEPDLKTLLEAQAKREAEFDPAKLGEANNKIRVDYEAAAAKALAEGKPKPPGPFLGVGPKQDKQRPACLYNGMIAPLQPYALRGVIWYQGESNSHVPLLYRKLFPAMIASWRQHWGQGDFPFLFVQLAPCKRWSPGLREAQLLTWKSTPNTAMVVTTDVGDANDSHPRKKEPVGARLALAARALAYGETLEYSGPEFDRMSVRQNRAVIHFTHIGGGLVAKDGDLRGFFIAGTDRKFRPAKAEIKGDTVEVFSDEVNTPVAVRYGWANVPDVNLYNKEGLPASPFRTDVSDSFDFPIVAKGSGAIAEGPFQPSWDSLVSQYRCPEWFRDAKFGIWAHWGPQGEPEQGGWYARRMYIEGDSSYQFHLKEYGHPSKVGFKDIIHRWKAEHFDPEKLLAFYKDNGAKYFMALANHHDNFDLWDSKYQPWNSVAIGPKKNLVGGWATAARKLGLRFGVSVHASRAWPWYETAQGADTTGPLAGVPYDGKLTKADGKGQWWEGLDPQDLYAQNHKPAVYAPELLVVMKTLIRRGDDPTPAYCNTFYDRTLDLIDKYQPDLLYFDDPVLPLRASGEGYGLGIAAHFYNASLKWHNGRNEAVINTKRLNDRQRKAIVYDIECGKAEGILPEPWQTDTCLARWDYSREVFQRHWYKDARTVVTMLADIVSKNGNLMLSVPLCRDGTLDEDEVKIVNGIGAWLKVNGEAIYATRPWKAYGEGPSTEKPPEKGEHGGIKDTSKKPFTPEDIRFTQSKDGKKLYAIVLAVPGTAVKLKSLAGTTPKSVTLLGSSAKLDWKQEAGALVIQPVAKWPCQHAVAFRIELTGN